MLGRFDPLLDDEDQHSEAEIHWEVKNSDVQNDKADPTGAESIGGKPARAENKENVPSSMSFSPSRLQFIIQNSLRWIQTTTKKMLHVGILQMT